MSFQAYLDNIEQKTGKTPNQFIELATAKGFGPDTKAGEIVAWLKKDFDLGHGHAMALVYVIKKARRSATSTWVAAVLTTTKVILYT